MKKKEYVAPELDVVELQRQAVLLDESYNDSFGLAPLPKDYKA